MTAMIRLWTCSLLMCLALRSAGAGPERTNAQTTSEAKATIERPEPTAADVPYGPHARQRLDFWQAKSDRPTPLVVFIHGGGWVNGDKSTYGTDHIKPF